MTDRSGTPLALDPFTLLEPAIVVLRAETEAREGLEALLHQLYGLHAPAIHLFDEPLALERGRLLLPGGSEALRVTAAGPPDAVAAARGVVTVLLALAPLLRDVERKVDTRTVLQSMQASHGGLLGVTPVMRQLHDRIARAARQSFTVLIQGESGAGKELVARQVHAMSARAAGPFVPINCAAIVESLLEAELFGIEERTATGVRGRRGRFEQADGGTLFLDEVSDLSASAQAKLLRIIQDPTVERVGGQGSRRVDVRIVAATNRPLQTLCKTGEFRRDLFYRLNAIEIDVPPLRARRDDIPYLCEAILQRSSDGRPYRLAPHALEALMVYEWPGNVRELERVIERAITLALGDTIQVDDLPGDVTGRYREAYAAGDEHDDTMRAWGSRHAKVVLRRTHGNKREACRILDISYHTLQAYLAYKGPRQVPPGDESRARVSYDTPSAGVTAMVHDAADEARHLDTTALE
jgi:transcriptional regulator with PAS, ATPase and Fis domain